MPIIESIAITPMVLLHPEQDATIVTKNNKALAVWNGIENYVTWVFHNGTQYLEPKKIQGTEKSLEIPWYLNENQVLTIIEEPEGVHVDCPEYKREGNPHLYWYPIKRQDADFYRIYNKETTKGVMEKMIQEINNVGDVEYFMHRVRFALNTIGGKWHKFRIESVNREGGESLSDGFFLFLHGYPKPPSDVFLSGTDGVFNINIKP